MPSPSSKDVYDYRYRGWDFPTLGFALRLNERILGHSNGLKDEGLLISALNAPVESAGGDDAYHSKTEKVAVLAYRVAANHPFHDANKRTALLLTEAVLEWNGLYLKWTDDAKIIIFSLVGAGFLKQAGLHHAILLGCGLDPLGNIP